MQQLIIFKTMHVHVLVYKVLYYIVQVLRAFGIVAAIAGDHTYMCPVILVGFFGDVFAPL